jgi:hypothetical protein
LPTFFCWSAEAEGRDPAAGRKLAATDAHAVLSPTHLLVDAELGLEACPALVHVGQLNGLAQSDVTPIRLLLSRDHAKERGLAGAVATDHSHDAAGR